MSVVVGNNCHEEQKEERSTLRRRIPMQCEKCKRESKKGGTYECFYGKHLATLRVKDKSPLEKSYQSSYNIAGHKKAFICRNCVLLGFLRSGIGVGILATLVIGAALLGDAKNYKGIAFIGTAVLILAGFIFVVWSWNRGSYAYKTFGDDQLIRAHHREWERQGYNIFLNRSKAAAVGYIAEAPSKHTPPNKELEKNVLQEPHVVRFYQTTLTAWSAGRLSALSKRFEKRGKISYEKLVNQHRPIEGSSFFVLFTQFPPREGEFLVLSYTLNDELLVESDWYVLTNYRLIQKDGTDNSYKEVVLADVDTFDIKKKTMLFRMKSGEEVAFNRVAFCPPEVYLSHLLNHPVSAE
jgi:hypothetical protein